MKKSGRPRDTNYQLIYDLKDKGVINHHIKQQLKIGEGTLRHALQLREKEKKNEIRIPSR
jgi:hypothetical protein